MTSEPTVAAVVANHNYAEYVGAAVESLLAQEVPFHEVVVVDDGSTDHSLDVLRRYEPRVRVVATPNRGQLSACLTGFDACSADYVYFLDADDLARGDLTRGVAGHLARRPVKVQFPLEAVDGSGRPTGSVFPTWPAGYGSAAMRRDNEVLGFYQCPPTSGNVLRADVLRGMDRRLLDDDSIDGPAVLALPYLGEVACVDRPLAQYRVHGRNKSQWFAPTLELLETETAWVRQRWEQVAAMVGLPGPPFGDRDPAYVLERRVIAAVLRGDGCARAAVALAVRLLGSHLPRRQVAALVAWALLLALPIPPLRRSLVASRRAPATRPAAVRVLVRWLSRARDRSRPPHSEVAGA